LFRCGNQFGGLVETESAGLCLQVLERAVSSLIRFVGVIGCTTSLGGTGFGLFNGIVRDLGQTLGPSGGRMRGGATDLARFAIFQLLRQETSGRLDASAQ